MKSLVHSIDDLAGPVVHGFLDARMQYLSGLSPGIYDSPGEKLVAEERLRELDNNISKCKAAMSEARKTGGFFYRIYPKMMKGEYQIEEKPFPTDGSGEN